MKNPEDILASGTGGSRSTNIVIRTQVSPSFGSAFLCTGFILPLAHLIWWTLLA